MRAHAGTRVHAGLTRLPVEKPANALQIARIAFRTASASAIVVTNASVASTAASVFRENADKATVLHGAQPYIR